MKLLKSTCEKAWFFDARKSKDMLMVGFCCFLPECPPEVEITFRGVRMMAMVPRGAIYSAVPTRTMNVKLSLFSIRTDE
jgi:hypothetical protein